MREGHCLGYLMLGFAYDYAQTYRDLYVTMETGNNVGRTDGFHDNSDSYEQVYSSD